MLGTIVAERYCVMRQLGCGGMGTVYLAEHVRVGRLVAIKILTSAWGAKADARRRFAAEAKVANRVAHPNVVQVFDAGELDDGRPFLVMQYVDGTPLHREIERCRTIEPRRACRIARDLARAAAAAHRVGIVHRDLKAQNVMLERTPAGERAMLVDFGIAADLLVDRRTRPGVVIGTPEYMAPEQGRGVTATTSFDVYALGVLMFEMLTGAPPFLGATPQGTLLEKITSPAPSVSKHCSDLPADLIEVVDSCLNIDPTKRPKTALELAERLDTIMTELDRVQVRAATKPLVTQPSKVARPRARRKLPFESLLATATVACAVAALIHVSMSSVVSSPAAIEGTPGMVVRSPANFSRGLVIATPVLNRQPLVSSMQMRSATAPEHNGVSLGIEAVPVPVDESDTEPRVGSSATAGDPAESSALTGLSRGGVPHTRPSKAAARPVRPPKTIAAATACKFVRSNAIDARQMHDWRRVIRHTNDAQCWESAVERTKLRVIAYKELNRFDECVRTGWSYSDPAIAHAVDVCRRRIKPARTARASHGIGAAD